MKTLKILGVPVASFGEAQTAPGQKKPLPEVPLAQRTFLSPRYEPGNITQNATVMQVQEAIRMAENGQTQEAFRFIRDVLLSDEFIQACFNTRKLAVLSQPLAVLPKDKNNDDDVALAAAVTQAIDDCENWNQGLLALMDSHGMWPVSIAERLFRPFTPEDAASYEGPPLQYTLKKFAPVNHQLECYQWAYLTGGVGMGTASAIQLANMGRTGQEKTQSQYTIDLERWEPYIKLWPIDGAGRIIYDTSNAQYLDPQRHVVHRGHLLTNYRDNWLPGARAILIWWLLRNLGREWFARGMERVGTPWPVGYTDASDPAAVALLEQAFKLQYQIGGLVVDESSRIELKEAMVQGMAQGYEVFYDMCNAAIAFHITGLRDTQKPAGLNAGEGNMQQTVRDDVRMMDMMMLAETCKNQIAKPFAQINGLRGNVKFVWGGLNQTDAKAFMDMLQVGKNAGLEVAEESLPTVNEKTGIVWEKAAPAPAPDFSGGASVLASRSAKNLKWLSANGAPSPVDDVVEQNRLKLAQAFRGSFAPVRQIILSSSSREDCLKKLTAAFPDWNLSRINNIVDEALQICAAKGAAAGVVKK